MTLSAQGAKTVLHLKINSFEKRRWKNFFQTAIFQNSNIFGISMFVKVFMIKISWKMSNEWEGKISRAEYHHV